MHPAGDARAKNQVTAGSVGPPGRDEHETTLGSGSGSGRGRCDGHRRSGRHDHDIGVRARHPSPWAPPRASPSEPGLHPGGGRACIKHTGGISLTAGSATISLSDFTIDLGRRRVSGVVAGTVGDVGRVDLFTIRRSDRRDLGAVRLTLTSAAAGALNTTFGVSAFAEDATFGYRRLGRAGGGRSRGPASRHWPAVSGDRRLRRGETCLQPVEVDVQVALVPAATGPHVRVVEAVDTVLGQLRTDLDLPEPGSGDGAVETHVGAELDRGNQRTLR